LCGPLLDKRDWQDDEGACAKVLKQHANHGNGFAQTHFIGNDASGVAGKLIVATPGDAFLLVILVVQLGPLQHKWEPNKLHIDK
jgi:hypothetical protein